MNPASLRPGTLVAGVILLLAAAEADARGHFSGRAVGGRTRSVHANSHRSGAFFGGHHFRARNYRYGGFHRYRSHYRTYGSPFRHYRSYHRPYRAYGSYHRPYRIYGSYHRPYRTYGSYRTYGGCYYPRSIYYPRSYRYGSSLSIGWGFGSSYRSSYGVGFGVSWSGVERSQVHRSNVTLASRRTNAYVPKDAFGFRAEAGRSQSVALASIPSQPAPSTDARTIPAPTTSAPKPKPTPEPARRTYFGGLYRATR